MSAVVVTVIKGDTLEVVTSLPVIDDVNWGDYTFTGTLGALSFTCVRSGDEVTSTLTATQTGTLTADGTTIYKYRILATYGAIVRTVQHGLANVIDV